MPLPLITLVPTVFGFLKGSWRTIAVVAAVLAVAYSGYRLYTSIYDRAYAKGVADTVAVYQPIIDEHNRVATERNNKIALLELMTQDYAKQLETLQNTRLPDVVNTVEIRYRDRYPDVAKTCGVSDVTADAYNSFLIEAVK